MNTEMIDIPGMIMVGAGDRNVGRAMVINQIKLLEKFRKPMCMGLSIVSRLLKGTMVRYRWKVRKISEPNSVLLCLK